MKSLFDRWFKKKWEKENREKIYYLFNDAYSGTNNPVLRGVLMSIGDSLLRDKPINLIELERYLKPAPKKSPKSTTPARLTVVKKGKK